jgi:hypothetical protein
MQNLTQELIEDGDQTKNKAFNRVNLEKVASG